MANPQKYYKVLSEQMTSRQKTTWQLGVPNYAKEEGDEMCSAQVLHCYNHPVIATLMQHLHLDYNNPRLFEVEVDQIVNTDGLKFASKRQTITKEIPLPTFTIDQLETLGITVIKLVHDHEVWNTWADNWLTGKDRSVSSGVAIAQEAAANCQTQIKTAYHKAPAALAAYTLARTVARNIANEPAVIAHCLELTVLSYAFSQTVGLEKDKQLPAFKAARVEMNAKIISVCDTLFGPI